MYSLAPVLEHVAALRAAGLRADLDPAKLAGGPGVWVQIGTIQQQTMTHYRVLIRNQLIARDLDARRSIEALVALANQYAAAFGPVPELTARTVPMPDGTPMPALEIVSYVRAPLTPEDPTP